MIPLPFPESMIDDLGQILGEKIAALGISRRLETVGSSQPSSHAYTQHRDVQNLIAAFPAKTWQRDQLLRRLKGTIRSYGRITHAYATWLECVHATDRDQGHRTTVTPHRPGLFLRKPAP